MRRNIFLCGEKEGNMHYAIEAASSASTGKKKTLWWWSLTVGVSGGPSVDVCSGEFGVCGGLIWVYVVISTGTCGCM